MPRGHHNTSFSFRSHHQQSFRNARGSNGSNTASAPLRPLEEPKRIRFPAKVKTLSLAREGVAAAVQAPNRPPPSLRSAMLAIAWRFRLPSRTPHPSRTGRTCLCSGAAKTRKRLGKNSRPSQRPPRKKETGRAEDRASEGRGPLATRDSEEGAGCGGWRAERPGAYGGGTRFRVSICS